MGESASCIDRAVQALATDDSVVQGEQDILGSFDPKEIAEVAKITGADVSNILKAVGDYGITLEDYKFLGDAMRAAINASQINPGVYNPTLADSNLLKRVA